MEEKLSSRTEGCIKKKTKKKTLGKASYTLFIDFHDTINKFSPRVKASKGTGEGFPYLSRTNWFSVTVFDRGLLHI